MNRGILFATVTTLVGSALSVSCRRTPDPQQLMKLDSLITSVEAASLTLDEISVHSFDVADSILVSTRPLFLERFADTLDRPTATILGDQFVQLRDAAAMRAEQQRVTLDLERTMLRLQDLRTDLVAGAMGKEGGLAAVIQEQDEVTNLISEVEHTLENHRTTQRVLEKQPMVDSLLAISHINQARR